MSSRLQLYILFLNGLMCNLLWCLFLLHYDIEQKHYVFENLNDQWMGVSLSSQYNASDGSFLVWTYNYSW